jgi:flagellar hook-basal body complex protein FliE
MAGSFAETLAAGEKTARAAMTGGADPHALVQALASSQLAVETVATVRDKVVEAYQEILRMPV